MKRRFDVIHCFQKFAATHRTDFRISILIFVISKGAGQSTNTSDKKCICNNVKRICVMCFLFTTTSFKILKYFI